MSSQMARDIPVMFSAPMILGLQREAVEQGTGKSMTSRLAWKPGGPPGHPKYFYGKPTPWQRVQTGDRLWVRENFWQYGYWAPTNTAKTRYTFTPVAFTGGNVVPAAPPPVFLNDQPKGKFAQAEPAWHLRPNIFLPRAHSRFTLIVTGTKIRRLQDITDVECEQEGVRWKREGAINTYWVDGLRPETYTTFSYQVAFTLLWNHLHGAGAWEANPQVVVLRFTVHKQNIDKIAA